MGSLGIFKCDANAVLMGAAAPAAGEWQSVKNTDVFIGIWDQLKRDDRWKSHDWTVKLDPDAVFFADRLKSHLEKLGVPKGEPIYIKNTNFKFGFMGALEIYSMAAMELFFKDGWECKENIGHNGGE